jgi:GNAT superfamily N-acetyltransferase
MQITLRTAALEDLDKIYTIRRDAILGIRSHTDVGALQVWAEMRRPDYFADRIAQGQVVVANAASDDTGWGSSAEEWITGLYVRSAWSGRGVGRTIMAMLESAIAQRGYTCAKLAASPNAIGFYGKLAYIIAGRPDAEGAVPMRKSFQAE